MLSSTSVGGGEGKKKDSHIEYFNMVICENLCSVRVKMKELTYNVSCTPCNEYRELHSNMKIKLKRADHDLDVEDCRPYIKRLIFLVNKKRSPMMFCAVDYNKFPKNNFWHVIYKLK